jgi:hypothetical protein
MVGRDAQQSKVRAPEGGNAERKSQEAADIGLVRRWDTARTS